MRKLPHILIMSSWYPTKANPFLGNFVKRHAELIASKYLVSVLNIESNSLISEITIDVKKTENLTEVFVEYPSSSNPVVKWRRAKKAFRMCVQHIPNVDLIHASNILSKGYQFLWAKKHFKKPLIITEHGSYYRSEVSSKWSLKDKQIIIKVLKEAALITAVSPFLKSEIEAVFPNLNVEILPNVVSHEIFKFKEKEVESKVKFIHISTLDERFKNISGIIEACEILSQEISSNRFELQIVSDEPYSKWEKLVEQKGLANFIHFSGPLQPAEICEKIQESAALILFSNYETFSIVLAEAWATGTPVISTPVGIAVNLDPNLGLQVDIQNVSDLVKAMRKFIHQEVHFDAHAIQSKSEVYNSEQVLGKIELFYLDVVRL
jgi:glycosyltransferase involved in cell wall biosynthesis